MKKLLIPLVLLCILSIFFTAPVSAHAVHMDVTQKVEIEVKGYFSEAERMSFGNIAIYTIDEDGSEELYIEDKLNEQGIYTFEPVEGYEEYRIKIYDDWGHQEEATINVEGGAGQLHSSGGFDTVTRIIAGLGYMLGLAGFGMLLSARKMKQQD
ncbi:hypothetical protein Mzhil_1937 [Methanosalsum zhilinae DSM 4017]|uniref:Uncharacterized protein n=1 Tax=Methanosalsum zhilinae (strain DSM 4017 / NBRC 107636 / OCM 62 / WeN5) TaxID=679901 RepID=F7XKQ9_METZD|nr:hypothetical protein [Methanosalsum zhilinae]AEH61772.1 hypothetical protein Mzhil_1937 [Methanosalsum zhilinae DSM 4017]